MAAPIGNKNALGNSGGKSLQDRKLAAKIRILALRKIKKVLDGEDSDYQRQILLRLSSSILPRLKDAELDNEGRPLIINFDPSFDQKQITGMVIVDESKQTESSLTTV